MTAEKHSKMLRLTECAVMLALSVALSFAEIIKMPMGGGITLLSMLPVMLISVKYGIKTGLTECFMYALYQLARGFTDGNVFVYCKTAFTVITVILFDYILPFTLLGLAGLSRKIKQGTVPVICAAMFICIALRFVCHYITGVVIWGQWADGMSPYLYSLLYNGGYLLPEALITCAGAAAVLSVPQIKKMTGITGGVSGKKEKNDELSIE